MDTSKKTPLEELKEIRAELAKIRTGTHEQNDHIVRFICSRSASQSLDQSKRALRATPLKRFLSLFGLKIEDKNHNDAP